MSISSEEFTELVRRMRAAQKDYFRSRDPGILEEARRLERDVDHWLKPPQRTLFDGQPAPSPMAVDPDEPRRGR